MSEYNTPDMYPKGENNPPYSVVAVPTAIPVFIGYTEKAVNNNKSLTNIPWKISSMSDFISYFGKAPKLEFNVDIVRYHPEATVDDRSKHIIPIGATLKPKPQMFLADINTNETEILKDSNGNNRTYKVNYAFCVDGHNEYTLYYNLVLFFANGGGTCYIVSVGNYGDRVNKKSILNGLESSKQVQEITMVAIPEAVNLKQDDFNEVQQLMLSHCGYVMKNRFALLDIYPKLSEQSSVKEQLEAFWESVGFNFLSYGAAYFPWLRTSVLENRDLNGGMFTWTDNVYIYRNKVVSLDPLIPNLVKKFYERTEEFEVEKGTPKTINNYNFDFEKVKIGEIKEENKVIGIIVAIDNIMEVAATKPATKKVTVVWISSKNIVDKQTFHLELSNASILYRQVIREILYKQNLLPPSAAMAGIYTMVDNLRGVWRAPANVALSYVTGLTEEISDSQQEELNNPIHGKAINAIRTFCNEGIKVWGARTLDGNSLDWRYINIRRTIFFLEESAKNAVRAYRFEPNTAATWINIRTAIENFLYNVWKRGGLAGTVPNDAFEVHIGLGDTMTGEDVLNGILRVTLLVCISHPAEFMEITFEQQIERG